MGWGGTGRVWEGGMRGVDVGWDGGNVGGTGGMWGSGVGMEEWDRGRWSVGWASGREEGRKTCSILIHEGVCSQPCGMATRPLSVARWRDVSELLDLCGLVWVITHTNSVYCRGAVLGGVAGRPCGTHKVQAGHQKRKGRGQTHEGREEEVGGF